MARTATEDLVRQLNRPKGGGILVPLIEEFFKNPVEIEDAEDIAFLAKVLAVKSVPRRKGIYSPSMLAECVRKVYFLKTNQERRPIARIESHGYFHDGNWRHLKWQYALWKMHRAGIIRLLDRPDPLPPGTEIFTQSNKGDSGGTTDNGIYIPSVDWLGVVDWKGMNSSSFLNYVGRGSPPVSYITQSVNYAMLLNEDPEIELPRKIENVLIIGENKNGAIKNRLVKSPLGLYEWHYEISDFAQHVYRRKKLLRTYVKREEIPPAECTSTSRLMFKDCPFAYFCRGEVEKLEWEAKRNTNGKKPTVRVHRKRKPRRL